MAILYLLPAVRFKNVYSFRAVLSWIWAPCVFWLSSSSCTSYQVTLPEEGVHQTCKLVEVVFSLLTSNLAGGKGSVGQKPKKREGTLKTFADTFLPCWNPDSFSFKTLRICCQWNKQVSYTTSKLTISLGIETHLATSHITPFSDKKIFFKDSSEFGNPSKLLFTLACKFCTFQTLTNI